MEYILEEQALFQHIGARPIFLFGAGEDGKSFLARYGHRFCIRGFIDNGIPQGERGTIEGYPIYPYQDMIQIRRDELIVVVSSLYAGEMVQQLEASGFIEEQDFVTFWIAPYYPDAEGKVEADMEAFSQHNETVWKGYLPPTGDNKLIMLHSLVPSAGFITWSYFANYLAKEHEAQIWTVDYPCNYAWSAMDRLYHSFNANHRIYMEISSAQKKRAKELLNATWPTLLTKEDWLKITLDGVPIGEDIWSCYIRTHESEGQTDMRDRAKQGFLFRLLQEAIFWQELLQTDKKIKVLLFNEGIYQAGILRRLAVAYGIEFYEICTQRHLLWNHYQPGRRFRYYKDFFHALSAEEQKYGIAWAKKRLAARLQGDTTDIPYMVHSAFEAKEGDHQALEQNDKLKVVICPHVVWDDPYENGSFLFADHWEWLNFLGQMTLRTDYDWYLKVHPSAEEPDRILLHKLIDLYPKIKLLPLHITGQQLKEGGVRFALTVWGTLGHEYPALGIHVINAGPNPHMAFDFNWHPKTREEYEHLLLHLPFLHKTIDMEEIWQFYCIHYLYSFFMLDDDFKVCYQSPELIQRLITLPDHRDTARFREFLAECSPKRHQEILQNVASCVKTLHRYRDDVFLRKDGSIRD